MECRPAHDRAFFAQPEIAPYFEFIEMQTPGGLTTLTNRVFDMVFVDSDHSPEHCEKELTALWPITRVGTVILFHDCPEYQTPQNKDRCQIWTWLQQKVNQGVLRGTCFPSCKQMDCAIMWGEDYPTNCSPGLGIFIRC
jgi:hypothetical protein